MESITSLHALSNPCLIAELSRLARDERHATVQLIECLSEFDRRSLYLAEGFPSLYKYCTGRLSLCEYAAYARIEIARASRRCPEILERLRDGSLTLTNAGLLAPHLTADNAASLLAGAAGLTKEGVRLMIAGLKPKPPAATVIRKAQQPQRVIAGPAAAGEAQPIALAATSIDVPSAVAPPALVPQPSARLTPLSPETYKVQLTISRVAREQLREVQDLMRHSLPNGDAALIFERAIAMLLDHLKKQKLARTVRPRPTSDGASGGRHIPAGVRRAVAARDKDQCAFLGHAGRCQERGFLEFHHVRPFAAGGTATVENIQLRCGAHNAHEAVMFFGEDVAGRDRHP